MLMMVYLMKLMKELRKVEFYLLCQLYIALTGLDEALGIKYEEKQRKNGEVLYYNNTKYSVVRYADDFVIFARSKKDIMKVPDILTSYLEERGLILAEEKN